MLEDIYRDAATLRRLRSCVLADHLDGFGADLAGRGYCVATIRNKIGLLGRLARWMVESGLKIDDLCDHHARDFVAARARRGLRSREVGWTVGQFLAHLRARGILASPSPTVGETPTARTLERFRAYLREERALATSTIGAYVDVARAFLVASTECDEAPTHISADTVRTFLLAERRRRSARSLQTVASALRSFLRFHFLRDGAAVDLSCAVPAVRQGRIESAARHIEPHDIERVLDACDLASPTGRRNHAILLLLARLGLRASEVLALELEDVRWREGEIVVRGKGLVRDQLPLLPDVGAAIALYVRSDRPPTSSRRVFLRSKAPHRGFSHPSSISTIVTRTLARVGIHSGPRGAHALRHGLAVAMVRRGASLTEIGEVLRHRSPATTEIYAKLDFGSLRDVALAWPVPGAAS